MVFRVIGWQKQALWAPLADKGVLQVDNYDQTLVMVPNDPAGLND